MNRIVHKYMVPSMPHKYRSQRHKERIVCYVALRFQHTPKPSPEHTCLLCGPHLYYTGSGFCERRPKTVGLPWIF